MPTDLTFVETKAAKKPLIIHLALNCHRRIDEKIGPAHMSAEVYSKASKGAMDL